MPPPLTKIERVKFAKLLGFILSITLVRVNKLILLLKICNQRLYLLNQIKKQGLVKQKLLRVFDDIIIARIIMLLLLGGDLQQLQSAMQYKPFLIKVKRWGIMSYDRRIHDILDEIDYGLLKMQFFQTLFGSYFVK